MNPIMIQKIIVSLVIVLLSLATLYEARFIGLCQDGECFQMNRRAPIGRGDDFNDMYNFMRFVGQNKVIGRTFNSPFLGKRNGMEPNEKE